MIISSDLFDDVKNETQSQYKFSNLNDLISGIIEIKKKYIINAINSLVEDNISLSSAKGIGLDLWGNILHFSRYIPSESKKDYNYFNFNQKNYYNLIFYDYNRPNYAALDDIYYRQILSIIFQGMYVFPCIPKLNIFSKDVFSEFGEVLIRDTTDMSYQVYVFTATIPLWLKFIFDNFDILPRPAGVGFKAIERLIRRFGFAPDKPYSEPNYRFFNFNKKNFSKVLFYDDKNNYGDNYRTNESLGKDITSEEYQDRLKWAKNYISGFYNANFYDIQNEKEDENNKIFKYKNNKE